MISNKIKPITFKEGDFIMLTELPTAYSNIYSSYNIWKVLQIPSSITSEYLKLKAAKGSIWVKYNKIDKYIISKENKNN